MAELRTANFKHKPFVQKYNLIQYYLRKHGLVQPCVLSMRSGRCSDNVRHYSRAELKSHFAMYELLGTVKLYCPVGDFFRGIIRKQSRD